MKGSVLEKYTTGKSSVEPISAAEDDMLEDLGSFGWLRGVRDRAIMLELRYKDGKVTALGYAWLTLAEFDPSDGIKLHFGGTAIRITGRNLNAEARPNVRLLAGILRHRVPWIREADGAEAMQAPSNAVVIEEIVNK